MRTCRVSLRTLRASWVLGWEHVLPRQSFLLTMLIRTACQPGFTGSLYGCRAIAR